MLGGILTAPGWYPDPTTGQQRWFDGTHWGPPAPPPVAPPPPSSDRRWTIHYGFALIALISLIFTLGPGIIMISSAAGGDPDARGIGAGMGIGWIFWGGIWTLVWTAFAVRQTFRGRQ